MQVNEHQRFLHEVQKSSQGYDVGLYLLEQESTTCQYFGALTLTVVLQQSTFDAALCDRLVSDTLSRIQKFINSGNLEGSMVVIRKLMSNLSLAYMKHHETFNPILSFTHIFTNRIQNLDVLEFTNIILHLPSTHLMIELIFISILIEDISKSTDFNSKLHVAVHEHLYPLLVAMYQFLTYSKTNLELLLDLDYQALRTLHSWMSYLPNINGDARYENVSDLIQFLSLHFDRISDVGPDSLGLVAQTLTTYNEILDLNPNLLTHEQKQDLYATVLGVWGSEFIDTVVFGDQNEDFEEEIAAYIDLVLNILQLNSIRLSKTILDSGTQNILQLALRLTAVDGVPLIDDHISERMLLFWEELANVYQDSSDVFETLFESQQDAQFQVLFEAERRRIFDTVARLYWRKLHLPQTYSEIRAEFNSYRSSVADFFLVVYSLLKSDFYHLMSQFLIQASCDLGTKTDCLFDAEATMFILFKINDDTVYFESQANQLAPHAAEIFNSGFLEKFLPLIADSSANLTVISTLVQFCASNVFYFKTPEGSKHLGSALNIVFPLLLNSQNSAIALLASKTALRLCDECSELLLDFLPNLEAVVVSMLKNPEMDDLIRLRMFNAYSVIARSVKDVEQHSKILHGVVLAIAEAAGSVIRSLVPSEGLPEAKEEYLSSLLLCLVNVAKGSSLSDDAIDEMLEQEQETHREFWKKDPFAIKQLVFSIVQEFSLTNSALAQHTILVERCTLVLKAGLGEKLGGGFDVGNEAILHYAMALMDMTTNANTVPFIFGLVECLVSAEHSNLDLDLMQQLVQKTFTNKLSFLKTDPDMIKSAIDLFSKILECRPAIVLYTEIFQSTVIGFAVEGLAADELFVVKSILRFWSSILSLRRGTSEDHTECQAIFARMNLVEVVTAQLIASFVKTARSNLEYYYSIFRSLIGKYPVQFKNSLSRVLNNEALIAKVGAKELELFVHKLMVTRGRRTANDVLKMFWLAVNGLVEYNSQRM